MLTLQECRLLGISPTDPLPTGGQPLLLTLRSNSRSASLVSDELAPLMRSSFGVELHPGSFNLWSTEPLIWESPAPFPTPTYSDGEICPVILEECAIGIAFRANHEVPTFLEVFSPVRLRGRIPSAQDEAKVGIRLLAGTRLHRTA
jgi:hypothetical protein